MAVSEKHVTVLVTGAAGQIGYSIIPLICNGQMFGVDTMVTLRLVEIKPAMGALAGVKMELDDCSYPLVKAIEMWDAWDANQEEGAWSGIDYAVLVGGFPRKKGMLRADLLKKNSGIFQKAGENLEKYAKETTKVLVVANPANTNCYVCAHYAKKIPKENFCALTRLDYNRACGQLANKLDCNPSDIKDMIIWGNHSKTQVPDASFATVNGEKLSEKVNDNKWLFGNEEGQFMHTIAYRGAAVIKARGASSAVSAANASKDCVRDWHCGTTKNVAMSVWSTGNSYGVPENLFYSFPVTCADGKWKITEGFQVNDEMQKLMHASANELQSEIEDCALDDVEM